MKKTILLVLVLVMVLCCGCGKETVTSETETWSDGGNAMTESENNDSGAASDTQTGTDSEGTAATDSNAKNENPLTVDLKGATITIYQGNPSFGSFELLNTSTKAGKSYHEMLQNLQKKLNCKFKVTSVTEEKLKTQVMASAASGKALCNIVTSRMSNVGYYIAAGVLADMKRVSSMDLSKGYMNNLNMLNAAELGGAKYAVCSENGMRSWVTLYNKRILKEIGYDENYLYNLVDSKQFNWTNVKAIAKKAMKDLDGKVGMSTEDQWGFLTADESTLISLAINNGGGALLVHDKDGYLKYNMKDPKVISGINLVCDMYKKDGFFCRGISNWKDRITSFASGHSLFLTMTLEHIKTVTAKMRDDFGLLPIPMVEGASDYSTSLDWNADAIMILAGQSAKEQYNAGTVVQALLSECGKNKTVLIDEYKNRYLCDDKSAANMKIAIDATKGNVECVYCRTNEAILSGTYRPFWDLMEGKISSAATKIDETQSGTVQAINEINETAKKNKS